MMSIRKQRKIKALQNGSRVLNRWHNIPHGEICLYQQRFSYKKELVMFLGIRRGQIKCLDMKNNTIFKCSPETLIPLNIYEKRKKRFSTIKSFKLY